MSEEATEKALSPLEKRFAEEEEKARVESSGFTVMRLGDIPSETVEWVWKPLVPKGKLTIIQGDPGEGKTTFALMMLSMLSNQGKRGIYMTAEDGYGDTVVPRLVRQGANLNNIFTVITKADNPLTFTDYRLEKAIGMTFADMVIFDPVQAYIGDDVNMNAANEVRPVMSFLATVAETWNCAVVLIGHMNKAAGGKDIYRGLGSIDLPAAARSVILVKKDPNNPAQRIIKHVKSSLAQEAPDMIFTIDEQGRMTYTGEATEAAAKMHQQNKTSMMLVAADLYKYLQDGRKSAQQLHDWAEAKGISESTLSRAKKKLNLKAQGGCKNAYYELEVYANTEEEEEEESKSDTENK